MTLTFCRLLTTAVWHTLVNMRDRPLLGPPQRHTYTMTRVRRNSVFRWQRRLRRTTWELLSGRDCTFVTLGACTPARPPMRQRCRTVSAPPLHRRAAPDVVGEVANIRVKTSGLGSVRRHLSAGAYGGRHMDCMGGPAHQLAIHKSGGLRISVIPRRVSTFGAQRSGRFIILRPRRLCTQ